MELHNPLRLQLGLTNSIIVDLFAGGGGASTGIEAATGHPVKVAINHDAQAVSMHAVNHPDTVHYCEDIREIDRWVVHQAPTYPQTEESPASPGGAFVCLKGP